MCQSKEDGGERCQPSITARQRARLKRSMKTIDESSSKYVEIQQKLKDLDAASKLYGSCVSNLEISMPEGVQALLEDINSNGFSPLLVGGTVRDTIVGGTAPKDFDIEVYGTDIDTLSASLRASGYNVDEVGKSFGVLKVVTHGRTKDDIDISVPRTDSLTGAGHRGFEVTMDSSLSVADASARRDFTMNALTWDYRYNTLIDPHNGAEDLREGVLRHVSEAFAEDPLRCLRGFQFAGRFGMTMNPDTAKFCRQLAPRASELAQERIAVEWEKFYLKSKHPSKAMKVLRDMGWNNHAPGLDAINTDDSNVDAQLDTAYIVSSRNNLPAEKRIGLSAAIIMRDMNNKEAWDFTKTTIISDKLQKVPLMIRSIDVSQKADDYTLRRVAQEAAKKGVSFEDWTRYEEISGDAGKAQAIREQATRLGILESDEKPLLMGRHILAMTDRKPGRWVSELLLEAEERQFRGELRSEKSAIEWAKARIQ